MGSSLCSLSSGTGLQAGLSVTLYGMTRKDADVRLIWLADKELLPSDVDWVAVTFDNEEAGRQEA